MEIGIDFAEQLRMERAAANISQVEMSDRLLISYWRIRKLENGKVEPIMEEVIKLATISPRFTDEMIKIFESISLLHEVRRKESSATKSKNKYRL